MDDYMYDSSDEQSDDDMDDEEYVMVQHEPPTIDMRELEDDYGVWNETQLLSWFEEELVSPLEQRRSQNGIKPACPAITRRLLLAFNLDVDRVYSVFNESDKEERELLIQKAIGFREPKKEHPLVIADENELCCTCYCPEDELYSTGSCDHYICIDCFKNHYKTEVEKNLTYVKCCGPDCMQVYNDDVLRMLADDEMSVTIDKAKRDAIVDSAKKSKVNWFLLPCTKTVNCEYYFRINKTILNTAFSVSTTLECKCGATYCAKQLLKEQNVVSDLPDCDEEHGHEPVSCFHVKFYDSFVPKEEIRRKKVRDSDENKQFMENHTRPCPKCKTRVWRDGGCKHLSCRCGAFFCWHCKYPYTKDHDEHNCKAYDPQKGEFDENVIDIEYKITDVNKGRFDRTKEKIGMNAFDLAVLCYRFKGQDPELIWKVMKENNLDIAAEVDSGVGEPVSDEIKVWDQVSEQIKNQVAFDFTFPVHFLSNEQFHSKELDRDSGHLFTIIHRKIESSLKKIKMATHQVESLHRFSFVLKANTSPTVDVLIADVQELLDKSRNLGTNLAKELVQIQNPDFKSFEQLNANRGMMLESMATSWEFACEKLANLARKIIKSVKIQDDLDFWTPDPTHATQTDLFRSKEAEKKPEKKQEKKPMAPIAPPPVQEEQEVQQQYGYIEGTGILWDYINNEPVDLVVYE